MKLRYSRTVQERVRGVFLPLIFGFLLLQPTSSPAQGRIERGVIGSGGGVVAGGSGRLHGTFSQSLAGRSASEAFARFGFWHQAAAPAFETVIHLPHVEAPVGTRLTIPLSIQSVDGNVQSVRRDFTALIRYNASLLDPLTPGVSCLRVGETCFLEVRGTADLRPGIIAEIEYIAKLGTDTGTALELVEFAWEGGGEELHRVIRLDGFFRLLDVCREGDAVRLIHAGSSGARITVNPNPLRTVGQIEFISVEAGYTSFTLVDVTGTEVARVGRIDSDPDQLYRLPIATEELPSGAYTLLCRTPSETLTTSILITE